MINVLLQYVSCWDISLFYLRPPKLPQLSPLLLICSLGRTSTACSKPNSINCGLLVLYPFKYFTWTSCPFGFSTDTVLVFRNNIFKSFHIEFFPPYFLLMIFVCHLSMTKHHFRLHRLWQPKIECKVYPFLTITNQLLNNLSSVLFIDVIERRNS